MAVKLSKEEVEKRVVSIYGDDFLGWPEGYVNTKSKASVKCDKCGFVYRRVASNIFQTGRLCQECGNVSVGVKCGDRKRADVGTVVERLGSLEGVKFLSLVGEYKNKNSRARMLCACGVEFEASVGNLVYAKCRCGKCKGPRISGMKRLPEDDILSRISEIGVSRFIRWASGSYKSLALSKALMECQAGHQFNRNVANILSSNGACPRCSMYGYNKGKAGYFYALLSECGGYVKVGISNTFSKRAASLRRETPFTFSVLHVVKFEDGATPPAEERYILNTFEKAGLSGFDGATEWVVNTYGLREHLSKLSSSVA